MFGSGKDNLFSILKQTTSHTFQNKCFERQSFFSNVSSSVYNEKWDGSFEYLQCCFLNTKNNFQLHFPLHTLFISKLDIRCRKRLNFNINVHTWYRFALSPLMAYAVVRSMSVVFLLVIHCWLLFSLWESVIALCFVVRYFIFTLVLQSCWWGRESWLLCFYFCLPSALWLLCGSSLRCHGLVCSCDYGISWSYSLTMF